MGKERERNREKGKERKKERGRKGRIGVGEASQCCISFLLWCVTLLYYTLHLVPLR